MADPVTHRPIIFSAPMVRALLAGTKTQTRRIAKVNAAGRVERGGKQWHVDDPYAGEACPFGTPGDRLWVREACRAEELSDSTAKSLGALPMQDGVRYLADDAWVSIDDTIEAAAAWIDLNGYHHRIGANVPPIHMPRWASRITLLICDIRLERLDSITNADCIAEGISLDPQNRDHGRDAPYGPYRMYRGLWENIHGPAAWAANPYVWVVDFKRLTIAAVGQ